MSFLMQLIFTGITVGAIYSLVAIGFTLIHSASDVFNFAQGEFVMLGGMITAAAIAGGQSFPVATAIAVAATVLVGLALNFFAIQPAKDASPVVLLIITIGASVLIRGLASVFFGKDFVKLPGFFQNETLNVGGAVLQTQGMVILAGVSAVLVCVWLFLGMTLAGKAVRAASANRMASILVGINPKLVVGVCFGVSAAIGAVGGVLVTPLTLTSYDSGTLLAIKGFSGAMLGGMAHPAGPVVGGLLIGLIEAFGAGYVSSAYKDVFTFIILLLILAIRPQGLLGGNHVERV